MANPFLGYDHLYPLLAPVDIADTETATEYVDLRNAQKFSFLVMFGAITSTTTTDEVIITVEAATAEAGTEAAIGFRYRMSAAVGTNTWGAVASVASTGLGMGADDSDDMYVWIEIDPDILAANDYRYVRLWLKQSVALEACLVAVNGVLEARYKQTTHISATASASA